MPDDSVVIAQERQALMDLMGSGDFKVPNRRVDENVIIATWNIQNFNERKTKRSLQYIADICERFDIIALQEVKTDLRGLSKLQRLLPGNYKILVSDPTGNHERLAFLYDKRTVVSTGFVCEIGFNVLAKTHTGYQLHRSPYCASFRAGRFDFVIATAHIYFGKTKAQKAQRKEEIEKLVDFVDRRSRTEKTKVFDRDFMVVGDFNVPKEGDEFFKALIGKGFELAPNLRTNFSRTKTYDKVAWVPRDSFEFVKANVVPFGDVVYQDRDPAGGKKEISDHLPLWAEFQVNSLTQELDQIINPGP